MKYHFSIITPTFNSEEFISQCVQSVKEQKNIQVQHIIIDGKSSDRTIEFLDKLSVKYISEKDSGIYDALNKGMDLAEGEVIGILHSDDLFFDENVLAKVQELFQSGSDIVYGDLIYVNRVNTEKIFRSWKSSPFKKGDLEFGWMPAHPSFFIKRTLYEKYGGYDTSFKIAGDYDFMIRLLSQKDLQIDYIPEVVTKMRVGGVSNRSFKNILIKMKEDYLIASKMFPNPAGTLLAKNIRKLKQFF